MSQGKRLEAGDTVRGDHQIVSCHKGHFGVVYICRQTLPDGSHVYKAIKTFRHGADLVARGLFDRELAYWVRLPAHPNVVQAKDADTVNKLLILEFVRGPSLRVVGDRKPLAPEWLLRWSKEIASGLRFLHVENNFLHRDLRPANVLVDIPSGLRAKISDLGIGKPFDPDAAHNTVIGTFNYMAPEVFEGRTDFRSDIFSYGATVYYLATGRYAVARSTQNMRRVVPIEEFVPGIPQPLTDVILRCLQRDPEERPSSMDEVIETLGPVEPWSSPLPFRSCEPCGYRFYAESVKSRCPFCAFEKELHEAKEKLESLPG